MLQIAEPTAYYFAGPLREPEIVIVANTEVEAKAEFRRIAGKVVPPKKCRPVIIASPDIQELMDVELRGDNPKAQYAGVNEYEFPLLSHFDKVPPDWIIDPATGKVEPAGEFRSLPKSLLDLGNKPTADEVRLAGGRVTGIEWDIEVALLNERFPWLQLEDGEGLRQRLLEECTRWERRYDP